MKKIIVSLLLGLLLVGCADNSYETIPLSKVNEKVADGYFILDVREEDEYNSGHIPDSINKPLSELQASDFSDLSKGEKYIVICRSGNRSVIASDILFDEGYEIVNVSKGVSSWTGEWE